MAESVPLITVTDISATLQTSCFLADTDTGYTHEAPTT